MLPLAGRGWPPVQALRPPRPASPAAPPSPSRPLLTGVSYVQDRHRLLAHPVEHDVVRCTTRTVQGPPRVQAEIQSTK